MTEETKEEVRRVLLVNLGRTILGNDKEGYRFLEVTQSNFEHGTLPEIEHARTWSFDKSITKNLGRAPGMVFEADVTANSIKLVTVQYKGLWPNDEHRLRWETEHQSISKIIQLEARKKKDERFDNFEHRLEPIRDAYRSARGLQRSLILAHIVKFITS